MGGGALVPEARRSAKVTTGTGDAGYTGLLGPDRVPKYDARIEAVGEVDEATSALGLARASAAEPRLQEAILAAQRDLYTRAEVRIAPVFVMPGGTPASAALDLARAVTRRAERRVVRLAHEGAVANPEVLRYVNRLSDLLFVMARYVEGRTGHDSQDAQDRSG
jgi:cob(I)alamin adenosyltransferase